MRSCRANSASGIARPADSEGLTPAAVAQPTVEPAHRSGRVRPLATTGLQRHPSLPDVPTLVEAGYKGFDAVQWYGVVGPAGMPAPLVRHYNDTLGQVLRAADLKDKLTAEAIDPMPMTPAAFGQYIRAEVERWTVLARERKITLED